MVNKLKILLFIFIGVLFLAQCNKNEEEWSFCNECELNSWVGDYDGTGDYYSDIDGKTVFEVPTMVTIENTSGFVLKITVTAVEYFTTTVTTSKNDNNYFFEVPGSNSSLSLTLSKKGDEYKLSGTSKQYHNEGDTLFVDNSISFDVYR